MQLEKLAARNALEAYVYAVKQADEEAGDKLPASEKVLYKCRETISLNAADGLDEQDEHEYRLKVLQQASMPVTSKLHYRRDP